MRGIVLKCLPYCILFENQNTSGIVHIWENAFFHLSSYIKIKSLMTRCGVAINQNICNKVIEYVDVSAMQCESAFVIAFIRVFGQKFSFYRAEILNIVSNINGGRK